MAVQKVYVVVPNWNGAAGLGKCLDSLMNQKAEAELVIVDNASSDNSVALIESDYPKVTVLKNSKNRGFAGGVNPGIRYAIEQKAKYVALLNNDAVAKDNWLNELVKFLETHAHAGIATSKIIDGSHKTFDSTGEMYTTWGLPYPRGRSEPSDGQYDSHTWVFGASGGASLYRIKMLEEIGLFDEDFFAYYEDVDLSFRAQLAGWKVAYVPQAQVFHQIGATSGRVKNFYTYQTLKNLPMLFWKNVPRSLVPTMEPRFEIAYTAIFFRAISRGQWWPAFKGWGHFILLLPKKLLQRRRIQKSTKVSPDYIRSILIWDLPPKADSLRSMRAKWWRLVRKESR